MLTINDSTLDQKNDGTEVQADGDDNFEHNAFLFLAKVNPARAKPLRNVLCGREITIRVSLCHGQHVLRAEAKSVVHPYFRPKS